MVSDGAGGAVRVASIYAPNGNPPDTLKYGYKLAFRTAFEAHAQALLRLEEPTVLSGDARWLLKIDEDRSHVKVDQCNMILICRARRAPRRGEKGREFLGAR
ncbi:hypothetical protein AMST5_03923 [freshwater sediment metagenome]|uniref:Uncharacterized protein n=1 Tax=freshwater sediment metagenome TaxID=556182 RepID=A0AA48RAS4_9ZZZZ